MRVAVATEDGVHVAGHFGRIREYQIYEIEAKEQLIWKQENIVIWLTDNGIEPSRRQARQDVSNGAIRINGEKVDDVDAEIDPSIHFDGKFVIVRKGKKHYFLARVK